MSKKKRIARADRKNRTYKVKVDHLLQKHGYDRCFYTGLKLDFENRSRKAQSNNLDPTVEHLLPKAVFSDKIEGNYVIACAIANNIIGDAPLKVKFEVRERMKHIIFPPSMGEEKMTKTIIATLRRLLEPYKIKEKGKAYVWEWRCFHGEIRYQARDRYIALLTEEEMLLDAHINNGERTGGESLNYGRTWTVAS